SYSSDRRFAAGFLQIPPRGGHPCLKLMATTAFAIRDFNPIDSAHAGRTQQKNLPTGRFFFLITLRAS
ncbi:hypothetical protein, partial [Paenibacillus odorifer]|uniref:hypothetical protein n=1 Tax=Paenibacillus odorifer TaxID=189426 RepID=UPI001C4BCD3B